MSLKEWFCNFANTTLGCDDVLETELENIINKNKEQDKMIGELLNEREKIFAENKSLSELYNEIDKELDICLDKLEEHPKEKFWNNRYPKQDIAYAARAYFNTDPKVTTPVDVRIFFQYNDFHLEKIANSSYTGIGKLNEGSYDERAIKCLRWVKKNFKYVSDKIVVGLPEFWMFPFEALKYKKGDCDDGAILLANLMMAAKIPYWRIRLNTGDVKADNGTAGHAYVTYCRETDNEWVILDWCYWYDNSEVKDRILHKDQQDYYDIWFSWNRKYAFGKMDTMAGMPKDDFKKTKNKR